MSEENEVIDNQVEQNAEPEIEIVDEEQSFEAAPEPERTKVVDEDEERQKKHISLKAQFNKVQRDKYRAEHEAQQLRAELERYRSIAEQNSTAAMNHYDRTIELQINQAKAEKKAAKENGDYDAELAADEKLALAIAQKTQNDAYKAQQQYIAHQRQQQQQQQPQEEYEQQYQQAPEINDDTKEWLQNNAWFLSQNEEDQALAAEVQSYSVALETRYRRNGMDDQVFTKRYYDDIDRYIQSQLGDTESAAPTNPISRSNINMKPVRQAAPPSRAPKGPDAPARRTVTLSPQEKEMARIMNLSEQDYAKWKIKDMEKQQLRGRPY